jgi:hypothetical protein
MDSARKVTSMDASKKCSGDWTQENDASHAQQGLIKAMRDLGWGRMEDVPIRGGLPRTTRDTKIFRRIRVEGDESMITTSWHNRKPHEQHRKLFADCRRIGEGTLKRIEVSDGLPVHWEHAQRSLKQRA